MVSVTDSQCCTSFHGSPLLTVYLGYNYTTDCDGTVISAADNIEDVDEDGAFKLEKWKDTFKILM